MPLGTFHRGGETRTVDEAVVAEFVDNFVHRRERGIRRDRLAVDINHEGGAVGWYTDVLQMPEGLGARFSWTRRGREALEAGEYAYFSPTVYWAVCDRVTGEIVQNQLAGGALTNYPFFGEDTALYAQTRQVWYAATSEDEYPVSAYLLVENYNDPRTWNLRVLSWEGGALRPDHDLLEVARGALARYAGQFSESQLAYAQQRLEQLFSQVKEGGHMNRNGEGQEGGDLLRGVREFFSQLGRAAGSETPATGPGVDPEAFSNLQAAVTMMQEQMGVQANEIQMLTGERDTYRSQVETLQAQLGDVQNARSAERFAVMAEGFAHLPVQLSNLASQLQWLYEQDTSDGGQHVQFFMDLLRSADTQFAEAFAQRGHPRGQAASVMAQVESLVAKYQQEHPNSTHDDALSVVFRANPALYQQYTQDIVGGER
ncbi:MAG: hypothetical protein JXB35_10400 [Anaerolineae bacterium]|nr:hypothetical protein [Anaerolineae bacterium]